MADINLGVGGANSASGVYEIDNSLKFESDNTETLTRTPSSAGNEKTWTWSGWIKYTEPTLSPQTIFAGGTDSGSYGAINFRIDAGQMELNTASVAMRTSTQKFRDPSAWYHFVVAMDTTQSTADDRVKIYVNGSQITDFSVFNNPPQNTDTGVNANELQTISRRSHADDRYFSGYMAEVHLIDGTALTPTSFGEYDSDSAIWIPKKYTGSYGTNGYYLKFDDSSSLGADSSGNGNNFTLNNIAAADQATDTPTNNFCTLNNILISKNNLIAANGATLISGTNGWSGYKGTIGLRNGKWYWEIELATGGGNSNMIVGVQDDGSVASGYSTDDAHTVGYKYFLYYTAGGYRFYTNSSGTNVDDSASTSISGIAEGDIIGIALNLDDNEISFYKNGSIFNSFEDLDLGALGTASLYTGFVFPAFVNYSSLREQHVNFGGFTSSPPASAASDANGYGNFEYAPPSGYYAICTKNLAEYG